MLYSVVCKSIKLLNSNKSLVKSLARLLETLPNIAQYTKITSSKSFKQFFKLKNPSEKPKKLLKVKFFNVYYSRSHLKYYNFY